MRSSYTESTVVLICTVVYIVRKIHKVTNVPVNQKIKTNMHCEKVYRGQ